MARFQASVSAPSGGRVRFVSEVTRILDAVKQGERNAAAVRDLFDLP